jgi:RecA-family ATPase
LERVFIPYRDREGHGEPLRFPAHVSVLEEAVRRTAARLIVIDPLVAFLDTRVIPTSDQSVRWGLAPLVRLAEQYACAVLLVRHLNKRYSVQSAYRGGGSIGFLAACRSGWLIARDPEQSERCVLAQVKNNLGPPQPSLAYTVTHDERQLPTLRWLGPTAWTADRLLAARNGTAPATERDRAREFLTSFLAEGARTSRDVWAAVREEKLSVRTIERAKKDLEIRSLWLYADGQRFSYWLLPGQSLPAAAPADLEPWLAPLREQFPTPTPLDEM